MLFITNIYASSIEIPHELTRLERIKSNDPSLKSVILSCEFNEEIKALQSNTTVQYISMPICCPYGMGCILKSTVFLSAVVFIIIFAAYVYTPWILMSGVPVVLQTGFDMSTAYRLHNNLTLIDAFGFGFKMNQLIKRNRLFGRIKLNDPSLISADLTGIDMGDEEISSAFTKALSDNVTVRTLKRNVTYRKCDCCSMGLDVAEILQANRKIRFVDIQGFSISEGEAKVIAASLENNFVIRELKGIADSGVQALIKRNIKLRKNLRRFIFHYDDRKHTKDNNVWEGVALCLGIPEQHCNEEVGDVLREVRLLKLMTALRKSQQKEEPVLVHEANYRLLADS